jgi:hypothetical protein
MLCQSCTSEVSRVLGVAVRSTKSESNPRKHESRRGWERFQDELRVTSGRLAHAFHAKLTRAGSGVRSTNGEPNAGALLPQICPDPAGLARTTITVETST